MDKENHFAQQICDGDLAYLDRNPSKTGVVQVGDGEGDPHLDQ